MDVNKLLREWRLRIYWMQIAHYDASVYFERLHLLLGIPVIVLSTVVGTAIFATIQQFNSTPVKIITGMLSVTAGVLASLQTFLRYSERVERHRVARARYGNLRTEVEKLLVYPPKDEEKMKECLDLIRERWASVSEGSPTVPRKLWDQAIVQAQAREIELREPDSQPELT